MKKIFFLIGCIVLQFALNAYPYFAEYHENNFIILFSGEVNEGDIPRIKALERRYLEEMIALRQPTNLGEELENLGIMIEVIHDHPNVQPNQPIFPRR